MLVLGLIPREDSSYDAINEAINSRLELFGKSDYIRGIDYLDCSSSLRKRNGDFFASLYERDGVSLSQQGMERLADCLKEVINTSVSALHPITSHFVPLERKLLDGLMTESNHCRIWPTWTI